MVTSGFWYQKACSCRPYLFHLICRYLFILFLWWWYTVLQFHPRYKFMDWGLMNCFPEQKFLMCLLWCSCHFYFLMIPCPWFNWEWDKRMIQYFTFDCLLYEEQTIERENVLRTTRNEWIRIEKWEKSFSISVGSSNKRNCLLFEKSCSSCNTQWILLFCYIKGISFEGTHHFPSPLFVTLFGWRKECLKCLRTWLSLETSASHVLVFVLPLPHRLMRSK